MTFGILASSHPLAAGPEISDDFSSGLSAWDQRSGTWSTSSGQLVAPSASLASRVIIYDSDLSTQDHYAEVTVAGGFTAPSSAAIVIRWEDDNNFDWGRINPDTGNAEYYRTFGGSALLIASTAQSYPSRPFTFRVEKEGSEFRLKYNGSTLITSTGSTANTGLRVGLRTYDTDGSTDVLDDFQAGPL